MLIRSILARNFQRVIDAKILLGEVSLLIGPNGHGKTSLAEALEFALLGESPRGGVLAEVVHTGAKEAEAVIELDTPDDAAVQPWILGRTRTDRAGALILDDDPGARDADFAEAVRHRVGDKRAIACVLRSNGLLSMKPEDLQRFLVDLAGVKLDAASVSEAIGAEVVAASQRIGLQLPTSLAAFDALEERAVGARQEAKRVEKARKAKVDQAPKPSVEVGERKIVSIEAALGKLRTQRDAAMKAAAASTAGDKAAKESRRATLVERATALGAELEEARAGLAAMKATRATAAIAAELTIVRSMAAQHEADAITARRTADDLERIEDVREGDDALAREVPEATAEKARATAAHEKMARELEQDRRALASAKAELARTPKSDGCTAPCQHCDVQAAKLRYDANARKVADLEVVIRRSEQAANVSKDAARQASDQSDAANDAAERIVASGKRSGATAAIDTATKLAKETREHEQALLAEHERARAVAGAKVLIEERERDVATMTTEIARIDAEPEPEPVDPGAVAKLDERIRGELAALGAAKQRDANAADVALLDDASRAVKDCDLVAKALGKDGARKRLIAGGVEPFLRAANCALAFLAPEWRADLDADTFELVIVEPNGRFRARQLSVGHRRRFLLALQYAVADLARIPFLTLDQIEDLDEVGIVSLLALVEACRNDGVQILMLSHAEARNLPKLPADTTVHEVIGGRATAVLVPLIHGGA